MKAVLFGLMIFILTFTFGESGSVQRNMASRTSLRTRGRDIRVESRRLAEKNQQVKQLDKLEKFNQQQGFHDVAQKHAEAKVKIEQSAKLNQDNLSVLSKKQQPSKMTRTSSGKQRIVPAITVHLVMANLVHSTRIIKQLKKLTSRSGSGQGWKDMPEKDRRGHLTIQKAQLANRKHVIQRSENKAIEALAAGRKDEAEKYKKVVLDRQKSVIRLSDNVSALETSKTLKMKESNGNKLHFTPKLT